MIALSVAPRLRDKLSRVAAPTPTFEQPAPHDKRGSTMVRKLILLAFAMTLTACSSLSDMWYTRPPALVSNGALVGPGGMTLYTFDRDVAGSGQSACLGPCAANWPPLMATPDAKPIAEWTILTRDDSTRQWAYKGQHLNYWSKDAKPGDRTGDGFNNLWKLARP